MQIIIDIPDEGKPILESWLGIGQITPWLQHAINNKLRQRLDATILDLTDKNPKKMSQDQKFAHLENIKLPTREEPDNTP